MTARVVRKPAAASTAPLTARAAAKRLREFADDERAEFVKGYFKTGPGEYGEGDRFIGVAVPDLRRVAREFRALPLAQTLTLLRSETHEDRGLALVILADGYAKQDAAGCTAIYRAYLANTAHINNWDLVDCSAAQVVGVHLAGGNHAPLDKLAKSRSIWERRIAIIATLGWVKRGEVAPSLRLAAALRDDPEDLIHKAVGWTLREVGMKDRAALDDFLERHVSRMPRTMLRYAIEKMTPAERRVWMDRPRAAK